MFSLLLMRPAEDCLKLNPSISIDIGKDGGLSSYITLETGSHCCLERKACLPRALKIENVDSTSQSFCLESSEM